MKLAIKSVMSENKAVFTEKQEFEYRDVSILFVLLDVSDYQDFDATMKMKTFSIEFLFKSVKFSTESFMEETKLLNREK